MTVFACDHQPDDQGYTESQQDTDQPGSPAQSQFELIFGRKGNQKILQYRLR